MPNVPNNYMVFIISNKSKKKTVKELLINPNLNNTNKNKQNTPLTFKVFKITTTIKHHQNPKCKAISQTTNNAATQTYFLKTAIIPNQTAIT